MSLQFLDWYLKEGFGWASKSEIDAYVFHHLLQRPGWAGLSVYELSNRLGLTEARVRSLMMRAHVKYGDASALDPVRELAVLFMGNKIEYVLGKHEIRFQVENPVLRREFEQRVRSAGGFFDTSFSRDVLRMSIGTFVNLLSERSPAFERRFKAISSAWLKAQDVATKKATSKLPMGQRVERFLQDHDGKLGLLKDAVGAAVGLSG